MFIIGFGDLLLTTPSVAGSRQLDVAVFICQFEEPKSQLV
jgi:hypothetical protein